MKGILSKEKGSNDGKAVALNAAKNAALNSSDSSAKEPYLCGALFAR